MEFTRRNALTLFGATAGLGLIRPGFLSGPAYAQDADQWLHGSSLFGNLKYAPDFKHFDYVNPEAPKGGRVRMLGLGSFDSLNPFTYKGRAAGLVAFCFDTLMAASLDEASTSYGLIAESIKFPADFSRVTYRLRKEAKFHDGTPVTPDDVIFSLEAIKKSHPFYAAYYQNVTKAEKTGDDEVTLFFDQSGNRELPNITGQLNVLSKAWWTGMDANGKARDLSSTTLEVPLGNGAYRVDRVVTGRTISLKRVEDYWAKDLPVNIGSNNIDEIVQEYFLDMTVAMQGFKADQYDWRTENSARNWATQYDFPAVKRGDVIKEEFKLDNPDGMQAFAFNTRRAKFSDPRVRQAFNNAFDFEWANKTLFYGLYKRMNSYFENSELAATGLPQGIELEILESVRDKVPPEVFTQEYKNPVNSDPQEQRNNLRAAMKLLNDAGWSIQEGVLKNAAGDAMTVEFLNVQPDFERVILPFTQSLKRLGVQATVRTVDTAQYQNRTDNFDFDIIVHSWPQSLSPGNEQRNYWGSQAAEQRGSQNMIGIKDPAIDSLIDRIIYAKSREELVAACHALDRVLLWHHFVVPQWYTPTDRTARWNRFSHPETMPKYSTGFPSIWWYDREKASKIKGQG
ncbi:microcin C transport system substrate-binding protein [Rhodoligotrophos appendicifer]|uniref:extracellular solute-binding protein n=1 Tax=Rhodoligotrophos appendicifer TaxID=987056 RepID=UPI00117FD0FC|nr:extracellular solute-binding protein [Rhodoligotrophos appendicifer]